MRAIIYYFDVARLLRRLLMPPLMRRRCRLRADIIISMRQRLLLIISLLMPVLDVAFRQQRCAR